MLSNQQLIDLMVSEPSWEDVIVKIIAEEGMDPWSIDIVKLADAFTAYIQKINQIDLRVPARFILIAAILVRMKSDILITKKIKPASDKERPEDPILKILAKIPPLEPPVKRVPLSNVTMDELLSALKKAFVVKERRIKKKLKVRRIVERAVPPAEEDITERINRLMTQIEDALKDLEEDLEFGKLLKKWEREDIVKALVPTLHLSQEGKIHISQKEIFKEIYLKLRKDDITAGDNIGEQTKDKKDKFDALTRRSGGAPGEQTKDKKDKFDAHPLRSGGAPGEHKSKKKNKE